MELTALSILILSYILYIKLTDLNNILKESNKILNLIQSSAWRKL